MYAPPLPIRAAIPVQILLDLIIRIVFVEKYRSLRSSLCSFLHSLATSQLLGPNILLNTPNLRSSHNVSDRVSHLFKTAWKNYTRDVLISP